MCIILTRQWRLIVTATLLTLLTACSDSDNNSDNNNKDAEILGEFTVTVLSSKIDQVSNDETRIRIEAPTTLALNSIQVRLNGADVSSHFHSDKQAHHIEGRIDNLDIGDNTLVISSRDDDMTEASLTLTNHPASGPIFSGPQQSPFFCAVDDDLASLELGPIGDEQCTVDTIVSYKYRSTSGQWQDYDPNAARPSDMATTTTTDGLESDFIVRWERGTLNRFLYSIAVLSPTPDEEDAPDLSRWNKRLVYYFQGGVAIGHYQGEPSQRRALYVDALAAGYAVAYSTGTRAGTHYNLQVGAETALMLKSRFISGYGLPDYTVGVGASGGGLQQYIYAQNHPGLIDAGVPQYSYPDMITQTIHVGDCELLERWMDLQVQADANSKWANWENRSWLIGFNANNTVANDMISYGLTPWLQQGSTECIQGWRGLSPLVMNPNFGTAPGINLQQQADVEWTHFADLENIYGRAEDGFAKSTWDNVGVQYGLQALLDGNISDEEFIQLNWDAGSWKDENDMVQEGCPFIPGLCTTINMEQSMYPEQVDPWSWRNINTAGTDSPAPRKAADTGAISAAFASGMVNQGNVEIPLIDVRHYLEDELDMHNSLQSFVTRQRLLNFDGDASNQVIWFIDRNPEGDNYDMTMQAFALIDEWMTNIRNNPTTSIASNRPAAAVDSCFDSSGQLIASGNNVWQGMIDGAANGICSNYFQTYSTSRIVAGAPLAGDVFKCALQSIDDAISKGLYGDWAPTVEQRERLQAIFPSGVCDYTQPGIKN
ncbi:MAG: DUF6351 family protein [Parahaliea sp.]